MIEFRTIASRKIFKYRFCDEYMTPSPLMSYISGETHTVVSLVRISLDSCSDPVVDLIQPPWVIADSTISSHSSSVKNSSITISGGSVDRTRTLDGREKMASDTNFAISSSLRGRPQKSPFVVVAKAAPMRFEKDPLALLGSTIGVNGEVTRIWCE